MPDCCAHQTVEVAQSLWLQVLSVGSMMALLHCPGMCGPVMAGLRFGFERPGAPSPGRAALGVVAYQSGRAVLYGAFGAIAGTAGMGLAGVLRGWAPVVTLVLGIALIAAALRDLWPRRTAAPVAAPVRPGRIARLSARTTALFAGRPLVRALALGAVLAFMPCGVLFWVLSLSAASGSPWQGAALALMIVALTLPVLLLAAVIPAGIGRMRRFAAPWAGRVAFALSGSWLLLVSLAGLEVISHRHLGPVMLW